MKPNTADYKEIRGTIIKKKQTVFGRRYLYISDGDRTVSVVIGKSAFDFYTVGMKMTVGYVSHKLINCRPGIAGNEDLTE